MSSQSGGRIPSVFVFNALAEGYVAFGAAFTPKRHQALLQRDLANLPQFLCRQDDVVLVPEHPSMAFLSSIQKAGFPLPEFIECASPFLGYAHPLRTRELGRFCPWAWGPDSVALFEPLLGNLSGAGTGSKLLFHDGMAHLYSKVWSAQRLQGLLPRWRGIPWVCGADEVGVAAGNVVDALRAVKAIRQRGHHRVVVKQAFGLAGQNAIRLWEPEILDAQRSWLERSVEEGRQVVVEPWLERLVDFSIQLEMNQGTLQILGYTGLLNDLKGQFQANWAEADFAHGVPARVTQFLREQHGLTLQLHQILEDIRVTLEAELRQAGYGGPVGIDAFVYRTAEGHGRLKPIVEINPRYTMGRLTLELMKRTSPGCCGLFQLIRLPSVRATGFANFLEFAQAQAIESPLRLANDPVPKIQNGFLPLNDPARARVALAVWKVGRHLEELISARSRWPWIEQPSVPADHTRPS